MQKIVYGAMSRVFAVVLLLVGIGAIIGGNFAHGFVTDQLSQEKIDMPTEDGINALESTESQDKLRPYIGEQLTTGTQAEAFANDYIWSHMMSSSGGKTYEEISGEYTGAQRSMDPEEFAASEEMQELGALRQSLFMGDTLRGMLLNAYGWWLVGTIAIWVGVGAIAVAVILGILGFGPLRAKKTAAAATASKGSTAASKE
ncbi:hypothetical protein VR010_10400 [Actinomycetaceae bacterium L2_0104]